MPSDPTPPLAIPSEAMAALHDLYDTDVSAATEQDARAIAAPVVAAELRRLTTLREFKAVQHDLRARADEIEAQQ